MEAERDDAAALLQAAHKELRLSYGIAGYGLGDSTPEQLLRDRVDVLLRTGEPAPDPSYDVDEAPSAEGFEVDLLPETLPCSCGRLECEGEARVVRFYPAVGTDDGFGALLELRFAEPADHFAVDPVVLGAVLGQMAQ